LKRSGDGMRSQSVVLIGSFELDCAYTTPGATATIKLATTPCIQVDIHAHNNAGLLGMVDGKRGLWKVDSRGPQPIGNGTKPHISGIGRGVKVEEICVVSIPAASWLVVFYVLTSAAHDQGPRLHLPRCTPARLARLFHLWKAAPELEARGHQMHGQAKRRLTNEPKLTHHQRAGARLGQRDLVACGRRPKVPRLPHHERVHPLQRFPLLRSREAPPACLLVP
jgi:hypothetical protein